LKKSDFQLIGLIGTILGLLFLFGGMFASTYYEVRHGLFGYTYTEYPYTQYSATLFVAGVVLLVVGLAFLWRASQEKIAPQVPPPPPSPEA